MKITDEELKTICKLGRGEKCCAFLICGLEGFECGKGTGLEPIIRQRLDTNQMNAKGDNCIGAYYEKD